MPYITQESRNRLDFEFSQISGTLNAETSGELNYLFSRLIKQYIDNQEKFCYQTINDIVGALEGAKLEFYARIARPYEEGKINSNGDVYYD